MLPRLKDLIEAGQQAEDAGLWEEAAGLYEAALDRVADDGGPEDAAELHRRVGRIRRRLGDADRAEQAYRTSLAIAETHELPGAIARALNSLAILEQFRGGFGSAESMYIRAWRLAEQTDDQRLAVMVEQNLGVLANIRGDYETALLCYRSALDRFRWLGNETGMAWVLNNLGMTHVDLEQWDEAERCLAEAAAMAERIGDAETRGSAFLNSADLRLRRGLHAEARDDCDRAFEIFSRLGSRPRLAETFKLYGMLYRQTGKHALAERYFHDGVELAAACEDRLLEAEAERERALLFGATGRSREALEALNRSHQLFDALKAGQELLDVDRRLDRLEEGYLRVMKSWGESIESKDHYTAGHCQRVADRACALAAELGIAGRELAWFRMGAFLHDVGKIEVPADVLNKPGPLTPGEWELMKSHTTAGDAIVAELDFPWDIRPLVRSHHERWDGTGYPDGLSGEEIPIHARILCLADVYDALTTTRSYREALPREKALEIMESDAGRIFDPELFTTFRGLVVEGRVVRSENESGTLAPSGGA